MMTDGVMSDIYGITRPANYRPREGRSYAGSAVR